MHLEDKLSQALSEAPIDLVRDSLDKAMFDDKEEMKPEIVEFLKNIVDDLDDNVTPVIGRALVKGSILSYQWLAHTDVDLLVEIDENINDHQWDIIGDDIEKRYDGLLIPGTKHPLQVFAKRGKYDFGNADGIYDLYRGWQKGPYTHEADLNQYMDQFEKTVQSIDLDTGELRRDIIDFNIMNDLPKDEVKGIKAMLRSKLDEINDDVDGLLNARQKVKDSRRFAFDRDMTPEEIKKFGSKNLLPANIIQKMLERYHYMGFLGELKDLHDDDKIDEDDMDELANIFNLDDMEEISEE